MGCLAFETFSKLRSAKYVDQKACDGRVSRPWPSCSCFLSAPQGPGRATSVPPKPRLASDARRLAAVSGSRIGALALETSTSIAPRRPASRVRS